MENTYNRTKLSNYAESLRKRRKRSEKKVSDKNLYSDKYTNAHSYIREFMNVPRENL